MTDPIITEADEAKARAVCGTTYHAIAAALAQARAEGRLAGMEEAARVVDATAERHAAFAWKEEDRRACRAANAIAAAIRARTTKEG